jgi:hypothetical protein
MLDNRKSAGNKADGMECYDLCRKREKRKKNLFLKLNC